MVCREKTDRPFRCLDCQYRRELVRVYLTNVEQICRRFVEERRGKLGRLIEDKARWSRQVLYCYLCQLKLLTILLTMLNKALLEDRVMKLFFQFLHGSSEDA